MPVDLRTPMKEASGPAGTKGFEMTALTNKGSSFDVWHSYNDEHYVTLLRYYRPLPVPSGPILPQVRERIGPRHGSLSLRLARSLEGDPLDKDGG